MAKVTVRVERDPTKQPPWAKKFFQSMYPYSEREHHLLKNAEMLKRVPVVVKTLNGVIQKKKSFDPPVTVTYTTRHYWSFKWDSAEEQTLFLLKWS